MEITENNIEDVVADFRNQLSDFEDETRWPLKVVSDAIFEATLQIGSRWGEFALGDRKNFHRKGLFYYAAHWLINRYLGLSAEDPGNVRPDARMNVLSKSTGDESVAFRPTGIQDTGDDWLSTKNYGVEFYRLRQQIMGGVSLGSMPNGFI